MKTLSALVVLVVLSLTPASAEIWEEDFSGGLNGWFGDQPWFWDASEGSLFYIDGEIGDGWGDRRLYHPEVASQKDGFVLEVVADTSGLEPATTGIGPTFGISSDMTEFWDFQLMDHGYVEGYGYLTQWVLYKYVEPINTSFSFGYELMSSPEPFAQPRTSRVEFDGKFLKCYVDGDLVITHRVNQASSRVNLEDGYVGVGVWDGGPQSKARVDLVRFVSGSPRNTIPRPRASSFGSN